MVSRQQVVQGALNLFEKPRYLEIGVNRGATFHPLKAAHKVAVDPKFLFDTSDAEGNCDFYEVESDVYFGELMPQNSTFDVIYLDGMHTAEQTLRDLQNGVRVLASDGIIILDDVWPSGHIPAIGDHDVYRQLKRDLNFEDNAWMGDVFKVIYFVDTFMQQFSYAITSDNHGQAILWPKRRTNVTARSLKTLGLTSFEDLIYDRPFERRPYAEILSEVTRALQSIRADFARAPSYER